ncbi:extracellular solute-binding protein [Roseomonas sp. GC11]|uniref:extracellular solute-binding protein n=1 Tax=Roseomonas sp. GC11 TaxID=2950546 RepID=UPI00210EBC67|nr:extracellular solute-binding protein [Roseomonas sp. GC11]MCQ4158597.1 extracellular solute-binding protein [Roseomonas sp. GC11]
MSTFHAPIGRRAALLGLGAAAALPALPRPALAAGRVVVGTWGGDYARLLTKNIEEPLLTPKGWEVVQDQASDAPRRAKVMAERRLPRGTVDIQGFSAANIHEIGEAGAAEEIDYTKLANAANILPAMRYKYGIGHIYSGKVVLYNPKLVEKPAGFREAIDPKHGAKIGFIDIQYQFVMVAAALAAGGSVSDIDKGKPLLLEAKKAGARLYPTNEAFAQAMKTEEIALGMMWKARGVQWQNAGIPLETVAPAEGIPMYVSGFLIQKNAPNKAGAYAYMDAMLEKSAQEAFAVDMGFNPTVSNARVEPALQARIGFTEAEQKRLVDLDYAYLARENAAMKEWWDKVFKA